MLFEYKAFDWKSEPPESCPFSQSQDFKGVRFLGEGVLYSGADTWYPSWAEDNKLYSPWADGVLDGYINFCSGGGANRTAHAVITGDDPRALEIKHLGYSADSALPYQGRYPSANLVHNGIWYYGSYCLGPSFNEKFEGQTYNWPVTGPMPGFRVSKDYGKSWVESPHSGESPLFPEPEKYLGPVKIGAPHFVDFGKNMQHSPDGYAYLVAHGSDKKFYPTRYANNSWISGDQVYLLRVKPSPETINDLNSYEFYAGLDASGNAFWSNRWSDIQPLLEWQNNMGCVNASYNADLAKYFMCITDGWPTCGKMTSYILESDSIGGPWKLVTYMKGFGEQAYFLNFPTKFIEPGGRDLWLCYSGLFAEQWGDEPIKENPPGSRYGMVMQKVRLMS